MNQARRQHDHNIPQQLTPLIGRQDEIAAVCQAVLNAPGRLVTLTGAGGCGKTRLAMHVGLDLVNAFSDGVWFVELASLTEPTLIPPVIAAALELPPMPDHAILDTLAEALRSRRVLVVLDNCEHLAEPCARLAQRLLTACPGLVILATSREPLRIPSEVAWPLPPLAVPVLRQLSVRPEEVLRYPAVQLFVERARTAQPAFALTTANAAAVARICVRLDGLPLPLELAAARVRALTPEQIATRLDDMFRVLAEGGRTSHSRHQTLRATLDWSHDLLTPAERAVFWRLAVFAGGWTLEAAEAVCTGDDIPEGDVFELVAHLVDKSLVVAEELPPGSGAMRYRLLEPTRQYALERLRNSSAADSAERAHTAYYLELARPGDAGWRGSKELALLERIERDLDNFRAVLRRLLDAGEVAALLQLCVRLSRFWEVRGSLEEGLRWLDDGLARAANVPARLRMHAVGRATYLAIISGMMERVGPLSEEWLALARQVGDQAAADETTKYRAGYLFFRGDRQGAVSLMEGTLASARTEDSPIERGAVLMNLGWMLLALGDLQRAHDLFDQVVPLARAAEDAVQEAVGTAGQGYIAYTNRDLQSAQRLARQALTLLHGLRHTLFTSVFLDLLGIVASARGQLERAGRLFGAHEAALEAVHAPGLGQTRYLQVLRPQHEHHMAAAQSGPGAKRFSASWAAGRALSLEEAVAYALAEEEPTASVAEAAQPAGAGPLSPREREVVVLVARGLTNREIAAQLVITERTAGAHIEHILDKLGFASRIQIGVWASERGLTTSGPG